MSDETAATAAECRTFAPRTPAPLALHRHPSTRALTMTTKSPRAARVVSTHQALQAGLSSASLEQHLPILLLLHPFNGLFSRTTRVSRYKKGKTNLDSNEARDDGVLRWQWHQLDHMQTICTSLQRDNHTNTSSLNSYRPDVLPDAQQCQSTEGNR